MPMATKRGRWSITSHDPLIMQSYEITWQIRNVISPLPQCLKPPDLAVWWLRVRGFHPHSRTTIIKSHDLYLVTNVRSRDKLEKTPNFTRFMTTKLGRMVASGRRFVTQMPSRHWPLFVNVSIIWITVVLYCYALPWSKYHVNVLCETGNKKPFVLRYLSTTAEMKKVLSSSQPIPTDWPKSEKSKFSNGYSFHLETLAPVLSA